MSDDRQRKNYLYKIQLVQLSGCYVVFGIFEID